MNDLSEDDAFEAAATPQPVAAGDGGAGGHRTAYLDDLNPRNAKRSRRWTALF